MEKNKNKALQEEITQLKQDKTEETFSNSVSDSLPEWLPKGKEMLYKMLKKSLSEEEIKKRLSNNPIQLHPLSLKKTEINVKKKEDTPEDLLKNQLFNALKRRRSSVASEEITFESVGKKVEDK